MKTVTVTVVDDLGDFEPVLRRAVTVLRAMAYEHRLHILVVLREGEHTPAALSERIPAESTTVAHHLRFLLDVGLIRRERRGRNVVYSLRGEPTRRLVGEVLRHAEP